MDLKNVNKLDADFMFCAINAMHQNTDQDRICNKNVDDNRELFVTPLQEDQSVCGRKIGEMIGTIIGEYRKVTKILVPYRHCLVSFNLECLSLEYFTKNTSLQRTIFQEIPEGIKWAMTVRQ